MDKLKKIITLAIAVAALSVCCASAAYITDDTSAVVHPVSLKETITDTNEIREIAEENGFENPGKIVSITYSYMDCPVSNDTDIDAITARASKYTLKNIKTREMTGRTIHSSIYDYPGGTMVVSESVAATYSTSVSVGTDVLKSQLGFDVTKSYTLSDQQTVKVPQGKRYKCRAYSNLRVYDFDIYLGTVKKGTGSATQPIGVVFVVYEV